MQGQPPSAVRPSEARMLVGPSCVGSVRFRTADAANGQSFNLRISSRGKSPCLSTVPQARALVLQLLRTLIVMLSENAVTR